VNTESRRKAADVYAAKRKAEGWAKVTVWLSPEALKALEKLKVKHGSRDAALNAVLTDSSPRLPSPPPLHPRPKPGEKLTVTTVKDDVPLGFQRAPPGSRLKKGK